jgi:hypothetical protein
MPSDIATQALEQSGLSFGTWPQSWRSQVLIAPLLIAPARQYIYPLQISGEEDALARGALRLLVYPAMGGTFLATCALGFTSHSVPTAVFACPSPDELCAIAGGYAYIIDTTQPDRCVHLPMNPVVELRIVPTHNLLLFAGFHSILAWGANGLAWETARLSWEGVRIDSIEGDSLNGFGWNLQTDREVAFRIDLRTGAHTDGGF